MGGETLQAEKALGTAKLQLHRDQGLSFYPDQCPGSKAVCASVDCQPAELSQMGQPS